MIRSSKVNAAYDTLNLPRDAPFQAVLDRWTALRERLKFSGDSSRLSESAAAFDTIKEAEDELIAQREMRNKHAQSKSERDLDTTLGKLSQKAEPVKRVNEDVNLETVKKQKSETDEVKQESSSAGVATHDAVFEKLNDFMRDPVKYLRTVNVLCNVIRSVTDSPDQITPGFIASLIKCVEVGLTAKDTSGDIPLANSSGDNRAVSSKLYSTLLQSPDILQNIKCQEFNYWDIWTHICTFRNSLFEQDNFAFVKRCKELLGIVEKTSTDQSEYGERLLAELEITLSILCSKEVARVIPGRLNEVRRCMTEIFKLTRTKRFPVTFKNTVTQLQQDIQLE